MTSTLPTQPQLDRRTGLGASDVSAAVGLDPYRSPLDLYLEKKGLAEPFEGNEHTRWGNRIEPLLRDALAEKVNRRPGGLEEVVRWFDPDRVADVRTEQKQVTVFHPQSTAIWATPDEVYFDVGDGELIPVAGGEVKNKGARVAHRWGESGTDEIPVEVMVQCFVGMACCELEEWHVGAYFGGSDFRTYLLRYDRAIATELIDQASAFWREYVLADRMPPVQSGDERMQRTLARLFADHSDAIEPASPEEAEMVGFLVRARTAAEQADAEKELWTARVKQAIGDRAGLLAPHGKVTWKTTKGRTTTDYEAVVTELAQRYPDDVQRAVESATRTGGGFRRFLVTPSKVGAR